MLLVLVRFKKPRDKTIDRKSCFDFLRFVEVCKEVGGEGEEEGGKRVEGLDGDEEVKGEFRDAGEEFGVVAGLLEEVWCGGHDACG